jgi:hypothetical protein
VNWSARPSGTATEPDPFRSVHPHLAARLREVVEPILDLTPNAATPAVLSRQSQVRRAVGEKQFMDIVAGPKPGRVVVGEVA